MFSFLKSGPALVVTLVLIAQAGLLWRLSGRQEFVPVAQPLAGVPQTIGPWQFQRDETIDADTREVLKADDLLSRDYAQPAAGRWANLFVAAFRSQRNGKAPHSPKNCLPGSGWEWLVNDQVPIDIGASAPITVNRYIVQRGNDRSVVLYWYQSRDRVVASEYTAKFWVIMDAMRLNRTDTALVRVVVPVGASDQTMATETAVEFVKSFYGTLRGFLPA